MSMLLLPACMPIINCITASHSEARVTPNLYLQTTLLPNHVAISQANQLTSCRCGALCFFFMFVLYNDAFKLADLADTFAALQDQDAIAMGEER